MENPPPHRTSPSDVACTRRVPRRRSHRHGRPGRRHAGVAQLRRGSPDGVGATEGLEEARPAGHGAHEGAARLLHAEARPPCAAGRTSRPPALSRPAGHRRNLDRAQCTRVRLSVQQTAHGRARGAGRRACASSRKEERSPNPCSRLPRGTAVPRCTHVPCALPVSPGQRIHHAPPCRVSGTGIAASRGRGSFPGSAPTSDGRHDARLELVRAPHT